MLGITALGKWRDRSLGSLSGQSRQIGEPQANKRLCIETKMDDSLRRADI